MATEAQIYALMLLCPCAICEADIFTTVERALQINLFMQNKANFRKSQVNVSKVLAKDYENRTLGGHGKNKPNSKPIQTQSKPIAERVKLMQSVYLQRNMKKNADRGYEKTKPIQTQTKPILERMNVSFCATGYYQSLPATCACATCGEANTRAGIRVAGKPPFAGAGAVCESQALSLRPSGKRNCRLVVRVVVEPVALGLV